jgi:hypothetical protein
VEEIYAAGLLRPRGASVCHVISFQYLRSTGRQKSRTFVKYWEIIANNPSKAGWSLSYVSAVDCEGRTIWIADAHRDDGKCFVAFVDEKLAAFLQLESAIRADQRLATAIGWTIS